MIKFKTSKKDSRLIDRVVDRAFGFIGGERLEFSMDITATHCNGCPIDLEKLMAADDFNFVHDVSGIRRHLNRTTGRLEDCFIPRFRKYQLVRRRGYAALV